MGNAAAGSSGCPWQPQEGAQLTSGGPSTAPLTWGSRGALWRSRGCGGPPPSWTAAGGRCVGPHGQRVGDRPSPMGPGPCRQGQLQTAGGPSVPLSSSSWLSPGFPPATWYHCGRTPGFSVADAGRGEHDHCQGALSREPRRDLPPRGLPAAADTGSSGDWGRGVDEPLGNGSRSAAATGSESAFTQVPSRAHNAPDSPNKAQRPGLPLPPRTGPWSHPAVHAVHGCSPLRAG